MNELVEHLEQAAPWPHRVSAPIRVFETHISWVLLTGEYAYKIKKPVDFGFLDFSTLAQRLATCEAELRLNRRLAPELYLEVVAITGSPAAPHVGGTGPAIEYAVKMRQFDPEAQLDRELAHGRLVAEDMSEIAHEVARFHARAPQVAREAPWGHPDAVMAPVRDNFAQLRPALTDAPALHARLEALESWGEARFAALREQLAERRRAGRVRECHGDLHLGNLARLEAGIRAFDCIEFNAALRWIDTLSDVAFVFMDLLSREREDLAWRLLNAYLERSGDYAGLPLLRFYTAYRSMVRAKVAALQRTQCETEVERAPLRKQVDLHLALAESLMHASRPQLLLVQGVSGSGKTTLARPLAAQIAAIHLRSDVERKRLYGLAPLADSQSAAGAGLYSREATDLTYSRLIDLSRNMLNYGHSVLVDATFLTRARRTPFRALAREVGVPVKLVACDAPETILRTRLRRRSEQGDDASEADETLLNRQLARREDVAEAEEIQILRIDTSNPIDFPALGRAVTQPP